MKFTRKLQRALRERREMGTDVKKKRAPKVIRVSGSELDED